MSLIIKLLKISFNKTAFCCSNGTFPEKIDFRFTGYRHGSIGGQRDIALQMATQAASNSVNRTLHKNAVKAPKVQLWLHPLLEIRIVSKIGHLKHLLA